MNDKTPRAAVDEARAASTPGLPRRLQTAEGAERRVGVELEMIGLSLEEISEIVAEHLGLEISEDGRYERLLAGDDAGDWAVELDFSLLQRLGREKRDAEVLLDELRNSAEDILKRLADPVVPLEVVSPPLPMSRLHEVEGLIDKLRQAGARGTSDGLSYAFSMQFNPEVPDVEADTLRAYLQAFLCLYPWLYVRADINLTRRLTTYIDPFPIAYVRKVIATDYRPGLAELIDDYLEDNPTRNRALDLLPLFLHLDEARVRAVTHDPLIKPRPALHYRLPDCEIHLPEWGFHLAWNDWLEVEALADDPERLAGCCEAYLAFLSQPLKRWLGHWENQVEAHWLSGSKV
ncbi:MAG: amidoligase family protein [Gammaproteobacteria bacterium]|nr:amidoligase family protein [Gammaproteobacteria bacterium]